MLEALSQAVAAQLDNQVFTGGLALGAFGVAGAAALRLLPSLLRFIVEAWFITTLTVDSRSPLFESLVAWFAAHPYTARCRRLTAARVPQGEAEALRLSPGQGSHFLYEGGMLLWVERSVGVGNAGMSSSGRQPVETITLRALSRNRAMLTNLLRTADRQFGGRDPDCIAVHMVESYGEWSGRTTIRRRPLSSVFLADGVGEALLEDARTFLAGEAWYSARGIPWRRGYLLYGPPGTGKTSLIRALASELDLDLSIVNLASDRLDDQQLCALLGTAPARSVLLFEDIDAVFRDRDAETAGRGITFSGLLNAIDGVMSQEGHLLVMTTNHLDRLDPALIRPGRIDRRQEIGLATGEQIARMFQAFYPDRGGLAGAFVAAVGGRALAPAVLQGHFLQHRSDPDEAVRTAARLTARPR
ncbi:AAA family ATPase [Azospirillum sp. B21]|uniref:AAA family ATPase n=1 Tax=Azospirillum sp. B21 TaxID=2607496 RepID=UPI0011EC9D25|nr:AAA family ATPase [Azospirillum sp. B21]KAA0580175.1 AAA family ATPase [Azospirillum sp. B21]